MNIKKEQTMCLWDKYFMAVEDLEYRLRHDFGAIFEPALLQNILDKFLLITINEKTTRDKNKKTNKYVAREDFQICCRLLELNKKTSWKDVDIFNYNGSFLARRIKIAFGTFMIYEFSDTQKKPPVFIRNILYYLTEENYQTCEPAQFDFPGITILTTNLIVRNYIENAVYRKYQLDQLKTSSFANSSAYMGSKKQIIGFITEAVFPQVSDNSIFLDIMCGSGAVSNAFAQMGDVFASDAQDFCVLLAKIQGSGFNKNKACSILKNMYSDYSINLNALKKELGKELAKEETIFHMDLNNKEKVLAEYEKFIETYELYSTTGISDKLVLEKINFRKKNHKAHPYCLFTYYYANVYFGLAQCVQLDSIRYAVDQIEDSEERKWALGVLVVVTSAIGTTYAGHFAQPKRLDVKSLKDVLQQREKSAWLEFSKRMISISEDSERYPYPVHTVNGPWETALREVKASANEKLIVYLDAPYKREEYSRYYHILETIVKYDYPSSENKGRMRSKTNGERFNTEFFTKTVSKVEDNFELIITKILEGGDVCAWSYSDNGMASIKNVITRIREKIECSVYIYGMPYEHSSQGKKRGNISSKKNVMEYCIVFVKTGHERLSNQAFCLSSG